MDNQSQAVKLGSSSTEKMYATKDNLSIRIQTHEKYTQPKIDFPNWVLDHISWQGDERVLDVGCGAGLYLKPVLSRLSGKGYLIAADLSLGMLKDVKADEVPNRVELINADASYLPFSKDYFDVILANHMLYYVSNIEQVLIEVQRVLRPRGYLIAATNSQSSMQKFTSEVVEACRVLGHQIKPINEKERVYFNLENGINSIRKIFPHLRRDIIKTALVFSSPQPVANYIQSLRPSEESRLPKGLSWETLIKQVTRQVSKKIEKQDEYRVDKTTGVFIASNRD